MFIVAASLPRDPCGPGSRPACSLGRGALVGEDEHPVMHPQLHDLVHESRRRDAAVPGQGQSLLDSARAEAAGVAALGRQGGQGDSPSAAFGSKPQRIRYPHLVEEYLVEARAPGHLPDRPDRHPGQVQRNEERGQPRVFRRVRIAAADRLPVLRGRWPSKTRPSARRAPSRRPSRTARVRTAARSLPASGSLNSWQAMMSVRSRPRTNCSTCSAGPPVAHRRCDHVLGYGEQLVAARDIPILLGGT